jgi:hypothetical protein
MPSPVSKQMNAQMSEIAEKLGFVPGSLAKSPAELKQRMALLRDWYKSKNKRAEGDDEAESEKKRARKVQKQKRKEKLKTKKKKQDEPTDKQEEQSSVVVRGGVNGDEVVAASNGGEKELAIDFGVFKFSNGKSEPLYRERKRGRDQDVLKKLESEKEKLEQLSKTPEGALVAKVFKYCQM